MTTGLGDWKLENAEGQNILFYKGKNYIPKDVELQWDIVKTFHDHKTAGHPGEIGTYNAIRQHYWWPGLRTFAYRDVEPVSSLKLTDPLPDQHIYQLKEQG